MKYHIAFFVCLLLLSASTAFSQKGKGATTEQKSPTYSSLFKELIHLEPDPMKVASVSGFILERDAATFFFGSGTIYLCKPVAGRVCAAVFVGHGSVTYQPPTDIERKQLARVLDVEGLEKSFTAMTMIFADSTLDELNSTLTFAAKDVPSSVKDEIESALKYISDEESGYFDESIARALLNDDHNDLFEARFAEKHSEPLFFRIDPYEDEEVELRKGDNATIYAHTTDLVNAFHRKAYYSATAYKPGIKESIDIEHYTIDATIAHNMDFSADVKFRFKPLQPGFRWINLTLSSKLKIDSMAWGDGTPAYYEQTGADIVWVECDRKLEANAPVTLTMKYSGEIIRRQVDWFYLLDPHYWYPHHGYRKKATFDLIFHTPSNYKFASIGEKLSTQESDGVVTSHWVARQPARNASFNIGICTEYTNTPDTIPAITVYMTDAIHGAGGGSGMDKQVGDDIENSCRLFQYIFGPPLVTSLYATEIPEAHGEAFPGMVHLGWITFQGNRASGFDHLFRAHEVAHQWWGIGVDFTTYHDQWLSEGFAEYAGLLYLEAVKKDNEKFFKMLENFREDILGNRKSIFGKGREAGPIWLGYRTNSSSTPNDYDLIIYEKGAWVLHMLRNMLLELNTMKEEKFFDIMRDFYTAYKGGEASTEDFRKVVEKHVGGIDMGWFFREWVYGTAVPSYKFAYKIGDPVDGKYTVTCRVEQANVPEDFQMYVPIRIDFGDDKVARVRVLIQGKESQFDLPPLPMKPEELTFNDLNSVLCEVDNVGW